MNKIVITLSENTPERVVEKLLRDLSDVCRDSLVPQLPYEINHEHTPDNSPYIVEPDPVEEEIDEEDLGVIEEEPEEE
jgi:hypothetical protein